MNNKLSDYFFAFDSDSFDETKTKLYGYTISKENNKISFSDKTENIIGGCYILVEKQNDAITIKQDELSSLYLYYYKEDGYWAVGNSFYDLCRLLVEKRKHITVRNLYIDQYIHQAMKVFSRTRSMVEEIRIMECFSEMRLTKDNLEITKHDEKLNYIDINSKEGIGLIDEWIDKWGSIFKTAYDSGVNMQIDLSGGFDSRVTFSIANYAGIDLAADNVNIFSKIGGSLGMIRHLDDDYQIAEQIAERLGFELNKNTKTFGRKTIPNGSETQYEILRNLFMFTHKEGYLCIGVKSEPSVKVGGVNGELVRRAFGWVTNENRHAQDPFRFSQDVIDEHYRDLSELESQTKSIIERDMIFALETECKSHFGCSMYNNFLANTFVISPFNDKSLLKLNIDGIDPSVIFAIIIYRTTPEIFDIDFSSGRSFSDEVKAKAIELCEKYPKDKKTFDYDCEFNHTLTKPFDTESDGKNGEHVLFDTFIENRDVFVNYISGVWGEEYANKIYDYAKDFYLNKDNFFPNKWIVVLTSVIELLKLLGYKLKRRV